MSAQDRLAAAIRLAFHAPDLIGYDTSGAAAILAADPHLAADIELGERLRATGYLDMHIVEFSEAGYGLQHPIECRPDLIGCSVNRYLASRDGPDQPPGRYRIDLASGDHVYTALAEALEKR